MLIVFCIIATLLLHVISQGFINLGICNPILSSIFITGFGSMILYPMFDKDERTKNRFTDKDMIMFLIVFILTQIIARLVFDKYGKPSAFGLETLVYTFLFAPVFEEMFYRGFLYKVLSKKYSFVITALVVSIIFAMSHKTLWHLIPSFIFSLYQCYVYKKIGTLTVPILLHILYNVLAFFFGMVPLFKFSILLSVILVIISIYLIFELCLKFKSEKVNINLT